MPPPPLDEPRGLLATPALAPAAVFPVALTGLLPAPRRLLRRLLVLLPPVLLGVWAAVDWRTVSDGTVRLGSADPGWMLAALFFTCLTWLPAACVRQGALPERLRRGI